MGNFSAKYNNKIVDYLEDNNLFSKAFRTTDHIILFVLRNIVHKYINIKNDRIYTCFVDFQKAFDSVLHDALLLKLHNIGIEEKCFQTIQDMYRNSSVRTKTTNGFSMEMLVLKGVHQGNTLSPPLFNIFISNITSTMTDNHSPNVNNDTVQIQRLLYADDIVILIFILPI